MVVGLDGFLRVDLAVAVEIAEQFLLLRVHADDGQAGLQILLLETGDVLELGVAVGIAGAHRLLLLSFPPAVSVLAEQRGHDIPTDRRPHRGESLGDLPPRQVRPLDVGSHRIAGGVVVKHLQEVLLEGRAEVDQPFAATPFFRHVRCPGRPPLPVPSVPVEWSWDRTPRRARCTRRHHAPTSSLQWRHNAVDHSLSASRTAASSSVRCPVYTRS